MVGMINQVCSMVLQWAIKAFIGTWTLKRIKFVMYGNRTAANFDRPENSTSARSPSYSDEKSSLWLVTSIYIQLVACSVYKIIYPIHITVVI